MMSIRRSGCSSRKPLKGAAARPTPSAVAGVHPGQRTDELAVRCPLRAGWVERVRAVEVDVGRAAVAEIELVEPELVPRRRVLRLQLGRAAVGGERRCLVTRLLLDAGAGKERAE